jgi:hypothetical protein
MPPPNTEHWPHCGVRIGFQWCAYEVGTFVYLKVLLEVAAYHTANGFAQIPDLLWQLGRKENFLGGHNRCLEANAG